ncbi:MAG: putative nucleic acid-binding Zn ribbon protein [Pseudoalteromonas tetraodonis]|jgi:predicted nucleic acid-binding Zn ribbon protein
MPKTPKKEHERYKRRILQEWRILPAPRKEREVQELSDVVGGVLKSLGLQEKFTENEVRVAWKGVVGDFIAQHTRPHSLLNRILEVRVVQPSILYTLEREMKPRILSKLQAEFGRKAISEVKFRIG